MCLCCHVLSLYCVRFLLYSIHSVGQAFRGFLPAAFKTESDPQISHVTHHTGGIIKDLFQVEMQKEWLVILLGMFTQVCLPLCYPSGGVL